MIFKLVALLLSSLLLVLSIAQAESSSPVIQVNAAIELEMEHDITIGDIAEFSGFEDNELGEIRSIRLGDAPQSGESRTFTNVGLSQIFRRHIPKLQTGRSEKITLMIPSVVTITRKTFKLEAKTIEAELRKQWTALCSDCEFRISQLSIPALPTQMAPGTKWSLRTRPELPKGNFSVPLEVTSQSGRTSYWISGTIATFRTVPVAKRTISLGERIAAEDFTMAKKEVTYISDGIPAETEMTGAVAARAISAEQVLGRSMLRREQALKIGEPVKIVTGRDGWLVTVEGIAQQSGYIGDMVRVRVPRTSKILSGLLRERGVIEVQ